MDADNDEMELLREAGIEAEPIETIVTANPKKKEEVGGRKRGFRGHWKRWPNTEGIRAALDGEPKLKRLDNVEIGILYYPKRIESVNKTATFLHNNQTYRISDDFERNEQQRKLHPAYNNWAAQVHARMGGIDYYHVYTVWTAANERQPYQGRPANIVVHMEAQPMELDANLLRTMTDSNPILCKMKIEYSELERISNSLPDSFVELVDALANNYGPIGEMLVDRIPYFRMIRAPLLFRLWPQKQLMSMRYLDFCQLSDDLELGRYPTISFGFSWLMPSAEVDDWSLAQLKTAHHALQYQDKTEEIVMEFFSVALDEAKKQGHTYSSLEQLAELYANKSYYGSAPPVFNLNTLFGLAWNRPYGVQHLSDTLVTYMPFAVRNKIVKITGHCKIGRGVYCMDDYMKQEYVVNFINNLVKRRWNKEAMAILRDGCTTEADVLAKIAAKQPSPNVHKPGVPQWQNEEFQKNFRLLDKEQRTAVIKAVLYPVTINSGPPGSGKTKTGETLYYLFGDQMLATAMAPYGRIASMWQQLLDGPGYTFHRAAGLVKYKGHTEEAKRLKQSTIFELDEYGIQTHHHLFIAFQNFGRMVYRIVFFGDPDQMGAIGSGSFGKGLYRKYKDSKIASYLALPHRFAKPGTLPDSIDDFVWVKPAVSESMCIAWNMRQIVSYTGRGPLDLVYSPSLDNTAAKCYITPRRYSRMDGCKDMPGLITTLKPIFEALVGRDFLGKGRACVDKLNEMGVQILTQRNADRKLINEAVFKLAYGRDAETDKTANSIYLGERVTFSKNAYFVKNKDGNVEQLASDRQIQHLNVHDQAAAPVDDNAAALRANVQNLGLDIQLGLAEQQQRRGTKRKREEDPDDFHNGESDNVFNGEIRQSRRVLDIDPTTGKILEAHENHTARSMFNRGKNKRPCMRILEFSDSKGDRKLLNMSKHYDVDDMERANCLTSAKMQGSEDRIIIYLVTPSPYSDYGGVVNTLYNEELYTVMTRGKIKVIFVAGRDESEALVELKAIAASHQAATRNVMADLLNLIPDES